MRLSGGLTAFLLLACGASPTLPPAPPAPSELATAPLSAAASAPAASGTAASAASASLKKTRALPTTCDAGSGCAAPATFVDAVCRHKFPDLPLYLFGKHRPWQHLYVKAEWVEPVNVHGGEQSEAWMHFGEEVLVLRRQAPGGGKGVQLSGPTDVTVLRWDGTCATIREEMLVSYVPGPMQSPRVVWRYLSPELQQALLANTQLARAREAEKKGCRDSSVSHPTPSCDKAMQQLTDSIVLVVHRAIDLPSTDALPEWAR
jgi:hypothetical protein